MSIWNKDEAERATNGKASGLWQGNELSIDTRTIKKGDIFVALKGENTDGHNYIQKAAENGAASVIISKDIAFDIPSLKVEDCYKAIDDLAVFRRNQAKATKIAVTGSVGKTSTKEMLKMAFSSLGKTHSTVGNYNNRLGMPISLASLDKDAVFGVFELGMNHAGEIEPLSKMLCPDISIITNIAPVHIEFFDSVEGIAKAKAEIFIGMKPGSIAILPFESKYYNILKDHALKLDLKIINVGKNGDSYIVDIKKNEEHPGGSLVEANIVGENIKFKIGTDAEHLIANSILVLTAVKALGGELGKAAKTLENFTALQGRGQKIERMIAGKKVTIIDDSYNASPPSMKASILALGKNSGRKIAILADMLELGENAIIYHTELAKDIEENNIDKVITMGVLMQHLNDELDENKKFPHCGNLEEIYDLLKQEVYDGDLILIKGSYGTKIHQLISLL